MELPDHVDKYDEIVKVLNELRDYVKYHFEQEEKLLLEIQYRQFFAHKVAHNDFIEYIYSQDSIEEKIPQSPLHVVYEQLSQRMEYELVLYKENVSIPYKSDVCIQYTPRSIDGTLADQFFCAFDLSQVLFV